MLLLGEYNLTKPICEVYVVNNALFGCGENSSQNPLNRSAELKKQFKD